MSIHLEDMQSYDVPRMITSLEKQKNRPRYNVFVAEEFAFSIHEDILVKFQIKKGHYLDQQLTEAVLKAEEFNKVKQSALRYLSYRQRTKQEIISYLQKKGYQCKDVLDIVSWLEQSGFLNDQVYAQQWIEQRVRSKPRGRYMLKQELLARGVEEQLIEEAAEEILSPPVERKMMLVLLNKKIGSRKFASELEMKKKILPFLQRKGFTLELICEMLPEFRQRFIDLGHSELQ
jgi:regulatory protein